MKTNNPPLFLLDFSYLRDSKNQENLVKTTLENYLKFKCDSELDWKNIVDFGAILGAEMSPKWKKNEIKKQVDFKTKLEERIPDLDPRSLGRAGSLAASRRRAR